MPRPSMMFSLLDTSYRTQIIVAATRAARDSDNKNTKNDADKIGTYLTYLT